MQGHMPCCVTSSWQVDFSQQEAEEQVGKNVVDLIGVRDGTSVE